MISISGDNLTIKECVQVARMREMVKISQSAEDQINHSRKNLESLLEKKKPIYGINTGFGIFANKTINLADSEKLNRNLILSHAVGIGYPLDEEIVRAAMLIRANTLSKGYSGIRLQIINNLLKMLNEEIAPIIPSQGSLGSSGDLCQLAHLALVITKDAEDNEGESGHAFIKGKICSGKQAMQDGGIERVVLSSKEGLALINGATFSAAIAAMTIWDSRKLIKLANLALALSLEALQGCSTAFDPRIHKARNLKGQTAAANEIRKMIKGSTLVDGTNRVQDAYSIRCAPQVHGAVIDTVDFVESIISKEINAATDNPLIFNHEDVLSGGNFHGEPIALVMDYLAIALSELGAISERRIFRLLDSNLNHGLPTMLVDKNKDEGVNSGLMMLQYTAASLVLENQALSSPDSVRSLPTSANQEDHNANSMTAARHTRMISKNVSHILATEIYTALRAIDIRCREVPGAKLGKYTERAYTFLRSKVPYQPNDHLWITEIEVVKDLITSEDFLKIFE